MSDLKETVEEIRAALAATEEVDQQHLVVLAERYAAEIERIHKKAFRCRELLNEGRRNEAVRAAKSSGDLKEELALADFAEAGTWMDLCERLGLPLPPFLDVEAVGSIIEELYTESENLPRLLKSYRRLSLGGAPIVDRLRKLREIYQEDPGSECWKEDIKTFEEARIEEMARIAQQAERAGDLATLESLLREARSEAWTERVSPKFVKALQKLIRPHRRRTAEARYEELLARARDAHSAMDETTCREVMAEWEQVEKETGCKPSDAQAQTVAPIQFWLQDLHVEQTQERAYEAACAELERALDEGGDTITLGRLAATVLSYDREMPEVLASRFTARMAELKRARSRKFVVRMSAIAAAVILIAGVAAWGTWRYVQQKDLADWSGQITAVLDEGDLEGAGNLLEELSHEDSDLYRTPTIQGLVTRHENAVKKEEERKATFRSMMAKVEAEEYIKSEDRNPELLAEAGAMARAYDEKSRVQTVREAIDRFDREAQRQRETEFSEKVRRLRTAAEAVTRAYQSKDEEFPDVARDCLVLAGALKGAPKIPDRLMTPVRAISERVEQLQKQWDERSLRSAAARREIRRLSLLYNDPSALAEAAQELRKQYPDQPFSRELAHCVRLAGDWDAAIAWTELTRKWRGRLAVTSHETAAQRLEDLRQYVETHPNSPHQKQAESYLAYLETASKAWTRNGLAGMVEARRLLNDTILDGLHMVQATDGSRYYLLSDKVEKQEINGKVVRYTFEYVEDVRLNKETARLEPDDLKGMPKDAPQSAFAKEAAKLLTRFDGSDWQCVYIRLAEMARGHDAMDPILRANLVKFFLDKASACAYGEMQQLIVREARPLATLDLDVNWLDPDDPVAEQKRKQAERVLKTMDSLGQLVATMDLARSQMRDGVSAYRPVGMITKEDRVLHMMVHAGSGELFVLWAVEGKQPDYVKVAEMSDGSLDDDGRTAAQFPVGTLVFQRVEPFDH